MSTTKWIVVGGGDKGGIVVRTDKATSSPQADARLSTGALVKQLRLEGERLHYELLLGTGPPMGWVSTKLKDKELVMRATRPKFEVVIKPRMMVRKQPNPDGAVAGGLDHGATVEALEWSSDDKWIRVDEGKWAMIHHPDKGQLLKLVVPGGGGQDGFDGGQDEPQSLKKSWDVEFKFKGCGANVKGLAGGTGGASRDQLFEFLSLQHLQIQLRKEFREITLPLYMFDTGVADEADCVACFQTAGHVMVEEPAPGKKPKPSPGGVRQYVTFLGGLRCIVVQKEGYKPSAVVVLAHGFQVLGDDLYGLADYLAKPGLLLVLPEGPCECEVELPEEEEWRRVPRQWWLPPKSGDPTKELQAAATQFAGCVKDTLNFAPPDVKLVIGGFSQGAAVALTAALTGRETMGKAPNGLILLAAAAPPAPFPAESLAGIPVLVTAGSTDEVAPASGCEKLLEFCTDAGAAGEPLLRYNGGHTVHLDVAKGLIPFLKKCVT